MGIKFEGFDYINGGICAPSGFLAAGMHCGMRRNKQKKDVALIVANKVCNTAAVYTSNKVKASPLIVTKEHLEDAKAKAIICNSGNANACNADGEDKAKSMCKIVSQELDIDMKDVLVASTGVIGQTLDIMPIKKHIGDLSQSLSTTGSRNAAEAIMTTDTVKKELALEFELGDEKCRMGVIAKGSGMIHPNMGTLLCFISTDVDINAPLLQKALRRAVRLTLNRVSIDGDTSTNDMAIIMASGEAKNKQIINEGKDYEIFLNALYILLMNVARQIAADGEGATKLLECMCVNAPSEDIAEKVAKSVITSSLFKAAMFAGDANWGRILCAVGYADAEFSIDGIGVELASSKGKIIVCKDGNGVSFSEESAKEILSEDEIKIMIDLQNGDGKAIAWGCDLTYDYVKINADYRS